MVHGDTVMNNEMGDEKINGDLMVNNLVYKMPKALSLAVNRTMKRQYFHRNSYSDGENAIIDFNTGSSYIKCCNSYLTFNLKLTGTTPTGNFANGSAINILNAINIQTRSGTELDRIDRLNIWSKNDIRHNYGQDWITKFGSMTGVGSTGIGATDAANLSATNTKFVIPLALISGFFRPKVHSLIPPQLASGLKIELVFEDYRTAIFQKSGTVTGYTVSDISIMADTVDLSDATQKTLNMESASSGLEYTYPRIYASTNTISSTSINVQVRKAVSQANIATAALITQGDLLDVTKDSLKSETFDVSTWQYRLGSLYFPNQPIKTATDGVESYFISQQVYDKSDHSHQENSVSLTDFTTNGYGILSASFEKDSQINLSGLPINNSRVLELQATLASYTNPIELVVFLEYTVVVRAFIDNATLAL